MVHRIYLNDTKKLRTVHRILSYMLPGGGGGGLMELCCLIIHICCDDVMIGICCYY